MNLQVYAKKLTRVTLSFVVASFLFSAFLPVTLAQTTVLPNAGETDCKVLMRDEKEAFNSRTGLVKLLNNKENEENGVSRSEALEKVLGCAIKTGKIRFFMIPFFITYIIEFLIVIAGMAAVLFVVIGGFKYTVGGLTEDKDSGKKTVSHALIGLVVSLAAWMIVNFVQLALTS